MSGNNEEWQMHTCIAPHEAAVTCTKYDLTYELLWIGYIDGRVSSFSVDQHSDMRVYSSFKLTSSVIDIVPTVTGIVVVCANSVSIHTVGGLQQCSYKVDEVYDSKPLTASGAAAIEAAETRNVTFRCACGLDSALVGNVYTLNSMNRSRLLIGCSTSCVLVIEADFGNMTIRPIAQYDVAGLPPMSISTEISAGAAPSDDALSTPSTVTPAVLTHLSVSITCVLNNFTTCVVAASNGKVYVLDGKLLLKIVANTNLHTMRARSKPKTGTSAGRAVAVAVQYAPVLFGQGVITSSLQCYDKGGYITHLALDKSDNKTLFYCGLVSTGSGAGWKGVNEGYKYTADPLVHILDIRNNLRQMLPMTMPLASPTLIACGMIGMDRGDGVMAYTSSRLLSAAATGAVQLARVFNSTPDPMTASSIYVPLTMRLTNSYSEPKGVHATAIAVAGSGQYFVLGCNNGSVFQYYLPPTAYDESMAHPPLTVIRCDEGVETSRCEHPVTHTTMHHNAASLTNWPLDNFTYDNSDIELKNPYSTAILGSVASYTLPHVRSPADYTLAMSSRAYSQGESVMRREQLEEECIMTGREMAPHEADLLEFPLSSFLSTPHVALQTFKATHLVRREINMEILRATQQRDFIGYGHNPGYAIRNSLLQMQQLATQRGMKTSRAPHKPSATAGKDGMVGPFLPYQILDPRFTPLEKHCIASELAPVAAQKSSSPGTHPQPVGWPALATVATTAALLNPLTIVPPKHLRKHCNSVNTIQLAQAKKGFDKHVYDDLGGLGEATTTVAAVSADVIDADGANGDASATAGGAATPVSGALLTTAGLDNAYHYADCAYLNSLLQVLFAHNDIRALCMRAQRGSYHHRSIEYNTKGNPVLISTPSFLCEIGFIFHMMSQVIDFKCKSAAGDDNQAGEERRIVGHNDPAHRELNSDFDQLVVVPTRFQQIYAHSDQVATLGLLPSSHKAKEDTATAGKAVIASSSGELSSTTSAGQLVQPAFRFLLLQLNKEVEAEGKYYDSLIPPVVVPVLPIPIIGGPKQPPKAVSGAGAGATGPAYTRHQWSRPKENVIDAIFGLDIACENHYIKSDYSEVAPTTHALSLELVDPQTLLTPPVSALGVRQASVSNTGSHISIAQVLYKSLKKVQFLKGYCTHTQTYDAFQQTRTVKCSSFGAASSATAFSSTGVGGANAEKISHSLLTILCGQSMLCPNAKATNPLTGAVSVNGSPTLSYIDADGVLHLPAAIEMVSSVITTGGVAFEKLDYISCLLMVPMPAPVSLPSSTAGASAVSADTDTTASGEQKKHCWFIYDGKKEEVSTVPASVRYKLSANITTTLDANGSPTSSRTMIQTLDLCSVVSEIRSVTPDRATGVVNTQTHTILHQYLSGEWLLFNDYQIGRAAEESKSCVEEVLSCQTAYRKPAILLYTIRPESTAAATGTAGVGAEVSAAHPLEMIPFRSVSLASYAVPPAVLSAENLAQDTARPQYKGKHISYKIPPGCYRSTGPNAAVLYRDNDDGCPVPVIRDGDTEAAVVTGALSRSQTSELETGQAATGHQTLWEPFSLHPVSARYQQSEMDAGAYYYLAGANDLIAVDAEFVAIGSEKYEISSAGKRTVSEDSRQVLARVSLLYGGPYDESGVSSFDLLTSTKRSYKAIRTYVSLLSNEPNMNSVLDPVTGASSCSALYFQVLQDDYIIPSHTVTDYLTRFSGIIPEDLYPQTSSHNLTSSRIAYCKLRYFLDRGCIFVGHGLCKDFEIANIHVPSTQVIDTVNIFRLSHQRKISLKFLSYVLLQADIQDEVHDSIEDARTALLLYRLYIFILSNYGPSYFTALIHNIYQFGSESGWRIDNSMDSETLFNRIYPNND